MNPIFPHFEPLTLEDQPVIETIISRFPPYSDFNFTSLFCWNTNQTVAFSVLNGNLVIRFADYVTQKPFYSFLGNNKLNETAGAVLTLMKKSFRESEMKLIPEVVARELDPKLFSVILDEHNFDYIIDIGKMLTYDGSELKTHRNSVTRFNKSFKGSVRRLDVTDPDTKETLEKFFISWANRKKIPSPETESEFKAMRRFFLLPSSKQLITLGLYIGNELGGFSFNEILSDGYAMVHFEKADPSKFMGVYSLLMQETAKVLSSAGCTLLNYQQDLGIDGLKRCKASFSPTNHLQKYRVSWKV